MERVLLQPVPQRSERDPEQLGRHLARPSGSLERLQDQAALEFAENGVERTSLLGELRERRSRPTGETADFRDRKSTRLNSSHANISYAVFCLKKKKRQTSLTRGNHTRPGQGLKLHA